MDAAYLRSKANRCHSLADIATNPEIRRALQELAQELEAEAAAIEAGKQDAAGTSDPGTC
jgi:Flp pilus assembly CpaE family ATPase